MEAMQQRSSETKQSFFGLKIKEKNSIRNHVDNVEIWPDSSVRETDSSKDIKDTMKPKVETSVISMPALSSPVPEAKDLANPSVLEPALKVEPVSTLSVLAAS